MHSASNAQAIKGLSEVCEDIREGKSSSKASVSVMAGQCFEEIRHGKPIKVRSGETDFDILLIYGELSTHIEKGTTLAIEGAPCEFIYDEEIFSALAYGQYAKKGVAKLTLSYIKKGAFN